MHDPNFFPTNSDFMIKHNKSNQRVDIFVSAFLLSGAFPLVSAFFTVAFFPGAFYTSAFFPSAFYTSPFFPGAFNTSAFSEYDQIVKKPPFFLSINESVTSLIFELQKF